MRQYKVTFKRVEEFYQSILIEALDEEKAREIADKLSIEGKIEFDYLKESDLLEEHLIDVEEIN